MTPRTTLGRLWRALRGMPCECPYCTDHADFLATITPPATSPPDTRAYLPCLDDIRQRRHR